MENMNAMKQNNILLMREMFLNESSSLGEVSLEVEGLDREGNGAFAEYAEEEGHA